LGWRVLVQVPVDRGPGDAELGGDLGNGELVVSVFVYLVIHPTGELGLPRPKIELSLNPQIGWLVDQRVK
jgi:hypothetical protein